MTLTGNETEPGRYERGSTVTAEANPLPGHRFVSWTLDGSVISTRPSVKITVAEDRAVTANFD